MNKTVNLILNAILIGADFMVTNLIERIDWKKNFN